uniref:transposase n=1 Tax=Streptomyces canus TaxID=58343 RepID=UPI0009A124C9
MTTTRSWPGCIWTNTTSSPVRSTGSPRGSRRRWPPFRPALDLLDTIPGINQAAAEVIIAETGGDMSRFTSAKHLASWAWQRSAWCEPTTPICRPVASG